MPIRTMPLSEFLGSAVNNRIPGAMDWSGGRMDTEASNPISRFQFYDGQLWDHNSPLVNGRYSAVTPQTIMGSADPQKYLESLLPDGGKNIGLRYDPATGSVTYDQNDDDSFGEWLGVLGTFGGAMLGGGALNGMFGGLGAGAGAASEIGALTGSGGLGGGILGPTGAAAGGGLSSLIDLPWGVNQQGGGMDWITDLLRETGELGLDAATIEGGWNGALSNAPWWSSLPISGQNLVQTLSKVPGLSQLFGGNSTGSGTGAYSFPFGDVLGGILEAYGANKQQGDLMSLMDKSLGYIDPFHDQRPQYQTQFRNLTQTPSNFFKDPAVSSIMDLADETTSRKLASQGYNMSGNFASEIAKTRANEMFKNYMPFADMIGTAAGYKLSPGNVGAATSIGTAAAGAGQQALGGLGSAFNSAMTGEQPSYLDQIFGKQKNQNLAQLFMSGLS